MRVLMWEHFAPGGPIRVGGHHMAGRFLRDGARVAWCAGPVSPLNLVKGNPETYLKQNASGQYYKQYFAYDQQ